jgi:hypothetical protein
MAVLQLTMPCVTSGIWRGCVVRKEYALNGLTGGGSRLHVQLLLACHAHLPRAHKFSSGLPARLCVLRQTKSRQRPTACIWPPNSAVMVCPDHALMVW